MKCEICVAFQVKNVKQPMQTHEIPDHPWSRVSSDLFTLNCKEYVVLADSYSDFIEVGELKGTTANYIIEFLKEQFSCHSIPDVLVTDHGPQYCCREFTEFSREWEFKHVLSSPRHDKIKCRIMIQYFYHGKINQVSMDPSTFIGRGKF